jgi:hypothetical protein
MIHAAPQFLFPNTIIPNGLHTLTQQSQKSSVQGKIFDRTTSEWFNDSLSPICSSGSERQITERVTIRFTVLRKMQQKRFILPLQTIQEDHGLNLPVTFI